MKPGRVVADRKVPEPEAMPRQSTPRWILSPVCGWATTRTTFWQTYGTGASYRGAGA